jgi:hypothetical protein
MRQRPIPTTSRTAPSTNSNPSKQIAVPKVGLLIAPSTQTVGRDFINIENVYWTGRYSLATAYLDRASSSSMRKVGFTNYQQTPLNGTFAGVMTYNNVLGVTSDFVATYNGIVNFSDWSLVGCEFHSIDFAAGLSNQALYLDNVREIQFFGGNMSSSGSSIVNLAAGTIQDVLFAGVTFYSEIGPAALHVFGGAGGINNCQLIGGLQGISGTTAANSGTNTNFVQIYNGIIIGGALQTTAPTFKTANYSHAITDSSLIFNGAGSIALTLLSAASFPGCELWVKNIAAFTVVSASANVTPQAGGAPGTAILAATAGKWALLKSDGANWQIMASN